MPTSNRVSLLMALVLMIVIPVLLGQVMLASLTKLHLTETQSLQLIIAIVLGGLINIPLKHIVREQPVWSHPLAIYGLDRTLPRWTIRRRHTIIAVNVGGCLIPVALALYQIFHLSALGPDVMWSVAVAVTINTIVCYFGATPVPGVGIVMPAFISPITAAVSALLLTPEIAPPVALIAGVMGPLIGADYFHIHDLIKRPRDIGVASIGGAGVFDGILLSGMIAVLLT